MTRFALPVLVTVSVWAGLVVRRGSLASVKLEAEKLTVGPVAVPLRLTVWGLPGALSVKFSVALRLPVPVGVNARLTVHVVLGRIAAPEQVSAVLVKSLAFVPAIVTAEKERSKTPVLVTVTVWKALAVLNA
jgi:hypothetical protein